LKASRCSGMLFFIEAVYNLSSSVCSSLKSPLAFLFM
jgi:hypothetical protein